MDRSNTVSLVYYRKLKNWYLAVMCRLNYNFPGSPLFCYFLFIENFWSSQSPYWEDKWPILFAFSWFLFTSSPTDVRKFTFHCQSCHLLLLANLFTKVMLFCFCNFIFFYNLFKNVFIYFLLVIFFYTFIFNLICFGRYYAGCNKLN